MPISLTVLPESFGGFLVRFRFLLFSFRRSLGGTFGARLGRRFLDGLGVRATFFVLGMSARNYPELVHEDLRLRKLIMTTLPDAGVSQILIDRNANQITMTVKTAKPGIVIGRGGQNVRLAGKLTDFELDIESDKSGESAKEDKQAEQPAAKPKQPPKLKKKEALESSLLEAIEAHGQDQQ